MKIHGGGSGWLTACLSRVTASIVPCELELADPAKEGWTRLGRPAGAEDDGRLIPRRGSPRLATGTGGPGPWGSRFTLAYFHARSLAGLGGRLIGGETCRGEA